MMYSDMKTNNNKTSFSRLFSTRYRIWVVGAAALLLLLLLLLLALALAAPPAGWFGDGGTPEAGPAIVLSPAPSTPDKVASDVAYIMEETGIESWEVARAVYWQEYEDVGAAIRVVERLKSEGSFNAGYSAGNNPIQIISARYIEKDAADAAYVWVNSNASSSRDIASVTGWTYDLGEAIRLLNVHHFDVEAASLDEMYVWTHSDPLSGRDVPKALADAGGDVDEAVRLIKEHYDARRSDTDPFYSGPSEPWAEVYNPDAGEDGVREDDADPACSVPWRYEAPVWDDPAGPIITPAGYSEGIICSDIAHIMDVTGAGSEEVAWTAYWESYEDVGAAIGRITEWTGPEGALGPGSSPEDPAVVASARQMAKERSDIVYIEHKSGVVLPKLAADAYWDAGGDIREALRLIDDNWLLPF